MDPVREEEQPPSPTDATLPMLADEDMPEYSSSQSKRLRIAMPEGDPATASSASQDQLSRRNLQPEFCQITQWKLASVHLRLRLFRIRRRIPVISV